MPRLLDEYNSYLASINEPVIDSINQTIEWLWWSYDANNCGSGTADAQIRVNGGNCTQFSAYTNIAPNDDNPLVEFDCGSAGVYTFFMRATSAGGCSKLAMICYNVSACNPCNSTASIQITNGCDLLVASTNCASPTYEWRDPDNIFVGSTQSIVATKTGLYTVKVYNCPNCGTPVTATVNVTCGQTTTCNCSPQIFIDGNCDLSAVTCSGWTISWQYSLNQNSGYINTGSTGSTHSPTNNNRWYRAIYTKSGCSSKVSNAIWVNCITQPCGITIDSMTIDGNNDIQVSWSGAGGVIIPEWYKYNEVSGDCNVSDQSKFQVTLGVSSSSGPTSGTTTLTPANSDGCYEVLLDDGNCQVTGKIYWTNNCALPCDGNFRVRAFFFDHSSAFSSSTSSRYQITSFRVNSGSGFVEQLSNPVGFSYSSNITADGSPYNPTLINTINSLGILNITAEAPKNADLLTNGEEISKYFRIKSPDCWYWDMRIEKEGGFPPFDYVDEYKFLDNGTSTFKRTPNDQATPISETSLVIWDHHGDGSAFYVGYTIPVGKNGTTNSGNNNFIENDC